MFVQALMSVGNLQMIYRKTSKLFVRLYLYRLQTVVKADITGCVTVVWGFNVGRWFPWIHVGADPPKLYAHQMVRTDSKEQKLDAFLHTRPSTSTSLVLPSGGEKEQPMEDDEASVSKNQARYLSWAALYFFL